MSGTIDQTLSRIDDGRSARDQRTSAQLFLVLECDRLSAPSVRFDLAGLDHVSIGRGNERTHALADRRALKIQVPDRRMSSNHTRLTRLQGRFIVEDAGSKNGTFVNGQRVDRTPLSDGDLVEAGHTFFVFRDALSPLGAGAVTEATDLAPPVPELATFVESLRRQYDDLQRVGPSMISVLLLGETGTGKEVLARAIHQLSRRPGPFIAVNCGAIPQNLVEGELFGAKKGAYSGADADRPGLIKAADKGTLFLDEIGDLPESSQAALLRVLQEREVTPVGGTQPIPVDFRLVAATHRELKELVAKERFRADLLARISGITMRLLPLRERREDLGLLLQRLLERRMPGATTRLSIGPNAARAVLTHSWPYNVRQLEKSLETAAVLATHGCIELEHLPGGLAEEEATDEKEPDDTPMSEEDNRRRQELIDLLTEHKGNLSAVARATGKARMQIHRWLKRYRIDPDSYR